MINISADGAGTKLTIAAFDEQANILAIVRGKCVNTLFLDEETVKENIDEAVSELFSKLKKNVGAVKSIENLYLTMAGDADIFTDEIAKNAEIERTFWLSEGDMGIYAGTFAGDGLLASAGTGSDCFLCENGKTIDGIGGWGTYFGDEGSGFFIGKEAIVAAIRSHDGRGKKTVLEELVFEQLELKKSLWEICSLHLRQNFRTDVAALTKAVEEACKQNDFVALEIVEKAAAEIALAANTLMYQNGFTEDSEFTFSISGGAWKTSDIMIERFRELVNESFPKAKFIKPKYEPTAGGIILFATENGLTDFEDKLTELKI